MNSACTADTALGVYVDESRVLRIYGLLVLQCWGRPRQGLP